MGHSESVASGLFTNKSILEVEHHCTGSFISAKIYIEGVLRNDLISDIYPDPDDPMSKVKIELTEECSGKYMLIKTPILSVGDTHPREKIKKKDQVILVGGYTKSTTYSKIARFVYLGKEKVGDIESIEGVFYCDDDEPYSIRVYDKTNRKTVAERNGLENEEEEDIDFGTISNVPDSKAIFEIQVKSDDDKKRVYCDSVTIVFGG